MYVGLRINGEEWAALGAESVFEDKILTKYPYSEHGIQSTQSD